MFEACQNAVRRSDLEFRYGNVELDRNIYSKVAQLGIITEDASRFCNSLPTKNHNQCQLHDNKKINACVLRGS